MGYRATLGDAHFPPAHTRVSGESFDDSLHVASESINTRAFDILGGGLPASIVNPGPAECFWPVPRRAKMYTVTSQYILYLRWHALHASIRPSVGPAVLIKPKRWFVAMFLSNRWYLVVLSCLDMGEAHNPVYSRQKIQIQQKYSD